MSWIEFLTNKMKDAKSRADKSHAYLSLTNIIEPFQAEEQELRSIVSNQIIKIILAELVEYSDL